MQEKNPHKHHRIRVRTRYLKEGIKSMPDHNILELLLFYGIPYKDTNDIAHELIERFGDFNGVLDTPVEELMKVKGIGENAATLLHLVRDISLKYNDGKIEKRVAVGSEKRVTDFLKLKYADEKREIVHLVCVNSHGNLQRCIKICDGSPDSANIDNRMIVEAVIRFNTTNVILAHNHPQGFAVPSVADVNATRELIPVLNAIGVTLSDHIIVAQGDAFSMAKSRKYEDLFR